MMELIGYFASIGIGIILGLLGGGGSILAIPILVYFFGVDAVKASAYSLFIVGTTSLIGAIPKYKDHLVNIHTGVVFGVPSILAIFATRKWVIPAVPDIIFQAGAFAFSKRLLILGIFSILMIMASWSLISGRKQAQMDDSEWRATILVIEGLLIGFLTGLVGAGGGFLIIPALVWLTGLPFKTAVGTSLFIIAINALFGFLGDVMNYQIEWDFLARLTGLAIFGMLIGNWLQKRIAGSHLRTTFGWLILITGVVILIRELRSAIQFSS